MTWRPPSSIQQKLGLILLASVGLALFIAAGALLLVQARKEWRDAHAELSSQAEVVGLASEAALAFRDPAVGEQTLRVLVAQPSVLAAALFDESGTLFASYRGSDAAAAVPQAAPAQGLRFQWRTASVVRPVLSNRQPIGSVYVQYQHGLLPALLEYAGWLLAVTLASLAGALLLARRLLRSVTEPIEDVSRIARAVLEKEAFDLRARKRSNDEVGQLVDAFNTMLDELGRRAQVLQQSNRAKDQFLATLAHELRNPLAPLRTGLQILKRTGAPEPVARRTLDTMDRQLTHMVRLIDDLLDISRINSGKIHLEMARVSLGDVVQSAVELSRPAIDAAGHALRLELPQQPLHVHGDETRLAQAIGNLLNNAAKYTPPGGRIAVRVRQEGATAVVEVQDSGMGIPPHQLERVFQLFAQVHEAGNGTGGGLGIGLFLVRSLVQIHGGSVTASSDGVHHGSTFTVRLPCPTRPAAAPAGSDPVPDSGETFMNTPAPLRVLVVDDNVDAAETLTTFLDIVGMQTRAVHDGKGAVQAALEFTPDVVLLDIGLPGMTGYDVARAMRAQPALAGTMLIALTGWGADEDRRRAMEAGFDHHLTKPVDLNLLEGMLQKVQAEPRA